MCKIRPFGSLGWWNRYIRPSCICKRLWFVFDKWGFHEVSRTNYVPQKGDIRVWQNYPGGSVAGHIHLFNGQSWVSDFFEPNNDGPNPKYRKYNNYKIYRR